eukprot:265616-Amphidinium_carterae.1
MGLTKRTWTLRSVVLGVSRSLLLHPILIPKLGGDQNGMQDWKVYLVIASCLAAFSRVFWNAYYVLEKR